MTHARRPRDEHTAAAVAELADVDHCLTTVIDRARIIVAGGLPRGPNSDEDHMAISDAHLGLKAATGRAFPGHPGSATGASQRSMVDVRFPPTKPPSVDLLNIRSLDVPVELRNPECRQAMSWRVEKPFVDQSRAGRPKLFRAASHRFRHVTGSMRTRTDARHRLNVLALQIGCARDSCAEETLGEFNRSTQQLPGA